MSRKVTTRLLDSDQGMQRGLGRDRVRGPVTKWRNSTTGRDNYTRLGRDSETVGRVTPTGTPGTAETEGRRDPR